MFLVPSAAVSSFHDGKRFLVLGCMDGVIRVLDTMHKPPYPMFTLPGQGLKTISCMKVVGDTVIFRLHFQPFLKRIFKVYKFSFRLSVDQSTEKFFIVGFPI